MIRRPLFYSLWLLLALAGAAYGQQATTPRPDQPEARAFTLVPGEGNYLGITTENVTKETLNRYGLTGEPRGVAVLSVAADSPAAKAGLQKNDVILRFDGEAVTSVAKLRRLIAEAAPDHVVRLTISRNGAEQELTAALGQRKALPDMSGFILGDRGVWRLNGDEWQRFGQEWQQRGQDWQKQMDELRKRLDTLPRQGSPLVIMGMGRRIGVATTALTDQLADYFGVTGREGVLVTSVSENSPAAKAGLKAGDVITEVDGEKIRTAGDLARALNRHDDGEVTLSITRDHKARTLKVTPERMQPSTIIGPETLIGPPVALAFPHVPLHPVRVVLPRTLVTPRVLMPRPNRVVVL